MISEKKLTVIIEDTKEFEVQDSLIINPIELKYDPKLTLQKFNTQKLDEMAEGVVAQDQEASSQSVKKFQTPAKKAPLDILSIKTENKTQLIKVNAKKIIPNMNASKSQMHIEITSS